MASSKGKLPKGKKTRFEAFTTAEISRRDLKGAQYNPRRIDDKAKERLREGINRVGMVQPVVWNKRTGNIVGGHQRIEQLDALEGNDEYSLTVAVVDVDETREKELNILLNNPQAQGDWDLERLKKLLEDEEIDLKSTGFDPAEVFKLFGDQAERAPSQALEALSGKAQELKDIYKQLEEERNDKDDPDFYLVVVFKSYTDRKKFTNAVGMEDNRYVNGDDLMALVQPEGEASLEKTDA